MLNNFGYFYYMLPDALFPEFNQAEAILEPDIPISVGVWITKSLISDQKYSISSNMLYDWFIQNSVFIKLNLTNYSLSKSKHLFMISGLVISIKILIN